MTPELVQDRFTLAALLLMGDGMEADELATRLQPLAAGDERASVEKLEHMVGLGLVQVLRTDYGANEYVPTELGRASTAAVIQGQSAILQELESLETMRTELLTAIAHEFRTPLTAVRTAVGLLQDPSLPHESWQEQRLLQTISQSADVMQRLVTDFLDLARFRAGAIELDIRRFDAGQLAREAVDAMSALFQARNQQVVLSQAKAKLPVEGDRRRLLQALLNLLSNAQKFAPDGSTIHVTTEVADDEMAWTVTDNGPGIPEETRSKLFERFFTMSRSDSRQSSGTGLGLPLVMATAQAHGGTVDVASAVGQGSSFSLRIPVRSSRRLGEP